MEFLKRGVRFERNYCFAPLRESSIYKAFAFVEISLANYTCERMGQVFNNASREFMLHGEERYSLWLLELETFVECLSTYPQYAAIDSFVTRYSFEDLFSLYAAGNYTTWDM